MPYYRILVWTKKRPRPFAGIRWIENHNINSVQGMAERKAIDVFRSTFLACEVQMLAKTSGAVRRFIRKKEGKLM